MTLDSELLERISKLDPEVLEKHPELAAAVERYTRAVTEYRRGIEGAAEDRALTSLSAFVRLTWPVLEPGTELKWNWHLDVICDALQRQIAGEPEYQRLLIMIPPGFMKSLLVSVFAPAWEWLRDPSRRKLFLSNDDKLVTRDSRRTRELITSEVYGRLKKRAGITWELAFDQNQKTNFENTARGFRQCLSIGGAVTGKRADDIVIDDPIDAKAVVLGSAAQRTKRLAEVQRVIGQVLPSRVNDQATARWTLIMQRLHVSDPAGHAIKEDGWHVVCLPMTGAPGLALRHPADRRAEGELLHPDKFGAEDVRRLKRKLGAQQWAAQYEQAPTADDGGTFHRKWMRHYAPHPRRLICSTQAITVDCTFRDTTQSDWVALQVWGRLSPDTARSIGARYVLLDQIRARLDLPGTISTLLALCASWPQVRLVLVEAKANGDGLIQILRHRVPGLVSYDPKLSKEARASVAALAYEAGEVALPSPEHAPWIGGFIEEHVAFPGGAHDDQVDAGSQLLMRWTEEDGSGQQLSETNAAIRAMMGI